MIVTMRSPDDMHFHARCGEMLRMVLPFTATVFARGVAMGNLASPVVTAQDAEAYRREILGVCPGFRPIMTIMLEKQTTPAIMKKAYERGFRVLKYIPDNASTNSGNGVSLANLSAYYHVFETAQELGMVFSGHWESPCNRSGDLIPESDREFAAIPFLDDVVQNFPRLKIVVEHVSTREMVNYVMGAPCNVGATLTVHHACLTEKDVWDSEGNLNPDHYCKPVAKTSEDRDAVVRAMISGNPKFFFGSDSAPHPRKAKQNQAAGIFTAPVALPMLCELFEQNGAFSRLEDFVARFGAEFYGLPLNEGQVRLKNQKWTVPPYVGEVRVFRGDHQMNWMVDS